MGPLLNRRAPRDSAAAPSKTIASKENTTAGNTNKDFTGCAYPIMGGGRKVNLFGLHVRAHTCRKTVYALKRSPYRACMTSRPLRTTVIGSYPFPGWLEFAAQNLNQFGEADRAELVDDAVRI